MSDTVKKPLKTEPNRFVEEGDIEVQSKERPYRPCDTLRYDLKLCLLDTDCCRSGKTPSVCLKEKDASIPEECYKLRMQFFECKRSLVDMRTRFRGRRYD